MPLSPEQEHIWLQANLAPDLPVFNETVTLSRRGPCDPALLAAAVQEMVRRHAIWRTSFELQGDAICQRVHAEVPLQIALSDLTELPPGEREGAAAALIGEESGPAFDLGQAPLLRARIVKFAAEDHRLYLTLHRILADRFSIRDVMVPTLAGIYEDAASGANLGTAGPPKLAHQYADYAQWHAQDTRLTKEERQLDYWRTTLSGDIPALRLPADHAPPHAPSFCGSVRSFSIGTEDARRLKQVSQRLGVAPAVTLLTCFQTLLFRYGGQEDITVGIETDAARHPQWAPLIGAFANHVPIRTRPTAKLRFDHYVAQTDAAMAGAVANAEIPYGRLLRALRPHGGSAFQPIFNVFFAFQPLAPAGVAGWELTRTARVDAGSIFDLSLEVDERPEGLDGRLIYATDLFEAPTIERMIAHFLTLLDAALNESEATLAQLSIMTPSEREQLTRWNATARPLPLLAVDQLFEAQARSTPNATAVEMLDESVSYRELDRQADCIARYLSAHGAGPDTVVAVCLPRSIELIAALIGCMKAGAAYLPLDHAMPRARLGSYCQQAGATMLLGRRQYLPPTLGMGQVLLLDECPDGEAPLANAPGFGIDRLAYVLCTSGSTGKPKAVEISHAAFVNLLLSMRDEPGFASDDRLLAVTTPSFDIAELELFLPLISGGTVIMAPSSAQRDSETLIALIEQTQPTVMQATPSTWRLLVEAGWEGQADLRIMVGGEALPPDLAEKLLARGASVWNMYGPTETTIWSTLHRVDGRPGPVPIGRAIANTTAHVVDPAGEVLPVGVAGELYLGGIGLARGYRDQPKLTSDRFRQLPTIDEPRLYRTGDLVRRRPDGLLEWLSRSDDQVKIRGHRVEVAEIEATLAAHGDVAAAAVKPIRDAGGGTILAAYIVAHADRAPDTIELRRFVEASLPEYMVPARFKTLQTMPLTPNGKIDRSALPALAAEAAVATTPPRDENERVLAEAFGELLGHGPIGVHESFFDLGGHSLLAARLVRQIEQKFKRRLPLPAIFETPTVAQLAAQLAQMSDNLVPDGAVRSLMLSFESLGEDCEFGLVQRRYGAEPFGLLRFTGISPENLVAALSDRFGAIADPGVLETVPDAVQGDYVVHNRRYACEYRTIAAIGQGADAVHARELAKLNAMRPMLIRVLERGNRLCVVKSRDGLSPERLTSLSQALRSYGPTSLFYVTLMDAQHEAGDVAWLAPHVLGGWIDRFAEDDARRDSSALWVTLCMKARDQWQQQRG